MKFHLSRAVIAFGLGASLWVGSVSSFAAPQQSKDQGQTKDQTAQQAQPSSQQKQSSAPSTDNKPAATSPTTQPTSKRPLSTGEDPEQIGKRNINKGIWAHGPLGAKGTESEVKMGRMLAAQVDKEAKFVDDPIITEYVNRVGQNIVLHSDAKVPFTIKVIVGREFAVTGLRSIAATEGVVISASKMGKFKMVAQVVTVGLLILSISPGQSPHVSNFGKPFPAITFWTVPELRTAWSHLTGPEPTSWNDWQVLLYTAGRALLWVVVISSFISMWGYFRAFFTNVVKKEKPALKPSSSPAPSTQ